MLELAWRAWCQQRNTTLPIVSVGIDRFFGQQTAKLTAATVLGAQYVQLLRSLQRQGDDEDVSATDSGQQGIVKP